MPARTTAWSSARMTRMAFDRLSIELFYYWMVNNIKSFLDTKGVRFLVLPSIKFLLDTHVIFIYNYYK